MSTTVKVRPRSALLQVEFRMRYLGTSGARFPAAVTTFPRERYPASRSWTEQAYRSLVYFNEAGEGNHFVGLAGAGQLHERATRRVQDAALKEAP